MTLPGILVFGHIWKSARRKGVNDSRQKIPLEASLSILTLRMRVEYVN